MGITVFYNGKPISISKKSSSFTKKIVEPWLKPNALSMKIDQKKNEAFWIAKKAKDVARSTKELRESAQLPSAGGIVSSTNQQCENLSLQSWKPLGSMNPSMPSTSEDTTSSMLPTSEGISNTLQFITTTTESTIPSSPAISVIKMEPTISDIAFSLPPVGGDDFKEALPSFPIDNQKSTLSGKCSISPPHMEQKLLCHQPPTTSKAIESPHRGISKPGQRNYVSTVHQEQDPDLRETFQEILESLQQDTPQPKVNEPPLFQVGAAESSASQLDATKSSYLQSNAMEALPCQPETTEPPSWQLVTSRESGQRSKGTRRGW